MEDQRNAVLKKCISEIEKKLGWGDAASWTDHDFDQLSNLINKETHVLLSQITLKRLWGRISYSHSPSIATLNALAKFCDYENWRECAQQLTQQGAETKTETPGYINSWSKRAMLLALPILILLIFFFSMRSVVSKNDLVINPNVFTGVPVKVNFTYQLLKEPVSTTFIWPTWEQKDRVKLEDQKGNTDYIYYYPGFYRTKLMMDGQLLKEQDLRINTNGWLACVEQPGQPLYLQKHDFIKKSGFLEIEDGLLPRYGIPFRPVPPFLRFFYISDFKGLMNDNFDFETSVKSTFESGDSESEYIEVIIHCKDDALVIPVCTLSNLSRAYLYVAGVERRGERGELPNFYADIRQWVKIKVHGENKELTISLNDNNPMKIKIADKPTEIVGVQIRFNGNGSVRGTRLSNVELN